MTAATTATRTGVTPVRDSAEPRTGRRRRAIRGAVTGAVGGVLGLAPHVLHHVGFLAGTALIAGSGGTALFAGLGLAVSVPMLLRLYRRFATWRAPAIALAVSAAMFALSAFVIGPAISGSGGGSPTTPSVDHSGHH